jgi:hypothetical protein
MLMVGMVSLAKMLDAKFTCQIFARLHWAIEKLANPQMISSGVTYCF